MVSKSAALSSIGVGYHERHTHGKVWRAGCMEFNWSHHKYEADISKLHNSVDR